MGNRIADLTASTRSRCSGVGAMPAPWEPHVATDVTAARASGANEDRVARRRWSSRLALSLAFVSLALATGLAIDLVTVASTPKFLNTLFLLKPRFSQWVDSSVGKRLSLVIKLVLQTFSGSNRASKAEARASPLWVKRWNTNRLLSPAAVREQSSTTLTNCTCGYFRRLTGRCCVEVPSPWSLLRFPRR